MNDYVFNVGNLKIDEETGFYSEITTSRILPYDNRMWNAITYELSTTRIEYSRIVYSTFDYLRDLGGLFSAIFPICAVLMDVLQYRGAYINLASTMMEDRDESADGSKSII